MKKSFLQFSIFPLIILLCFTFSCQQPADKTKVGAIADTDKATIRESSKIFLQAWRSGDDAALAELYTENGILMPAGEFPIQGREAIQAWYERLLPPIEANLTIEEIDGQGDLAYVRGKYTKRYEPVGEPGPIRDTGKYIEIRRKQQDGYWLIAMHIKDNKMSSKGNKMSSKTFKEILKTPQFWLGSTFLAAAIRIIWFLISELIKWLKFISSSKKIKGFGAKLNNLDFGCLKKEEVTFSCLLVRYGTDDYIKSLASEQDKYEGRLQNKIIKLDLTHLKDSRYELLLPIPIHKRIGTQFKCFVEAKNENDAKEVKRMLKKCDDINQVDISTSQNRNRVYFIIDKFHTVKTVDKIWNNFCFPK